MRRLCVFAIGILVLSFAASTSAYTINDAVGDQIGTPLYDIYGINISQGGGNLTFDIFTNFPQGGETVGAWKTTPGDLALDTTGLYKFDYGVALTDHDGLTAGTVYNNATWHLSNDYDPSPGGYIYGKDHIVTLKSGDAVGTATFQWIQQPGSPDYDIHITMADVNGYLPDFQHTYYASANCANDFVGAPEPVASILFVTGGTVLLVRRMRKKGLKK